MALVNCDECGAEISNKAVACPKCGNPLTAAFASQVPPNAAVASRGARPIQESEVPAAPKKKGRIKTVIGLLILVVGGYLFYQISQSADQSSGANQAREASYSQQPQIAQAAPEPQRQIAQPSAPAPKPAVITISAQQLYSDYKENEVLADTKYKGKTLAVAGTVAEIGKDFADDPYVNLNTGQMFEYVRGNFAKTEIPRLSELHKGQSITLTCYGSGMVIGSPILDCAR